MRFITLNGKVKYQNLDKYKVAWDGKSLSKFQFDVKQFLKPYWLHHVVYEEMPVFGTRLKIDLYNANKRVAIEISGLQHVSYNKHLHGNNRFNYLKQIERDLRKAKWCEINDITLIDIYPSDLPLKKEFFESFGDIL